jgi:hypothetical protein
MPSLKNLVDAQVGVSFAFAGAFGMGPRKRHGRVLALALVRSVHHALKEYEAARNTLWAKADGASLIANRIDAVNHLETSVVALHRAVRCAAALRKQGDTYVDGTPLVARPKDGGLLGNAATTTLRAFRDAVQHLDDDIVQGKTPPGVPIAILPRRNGFVIRDIELRYDELASLLTDAHDLAARIAQFKSPAADA